MFFFLSGFNFGMVFFSFVAENYKFAIVHGFLGAVLLAFGVCS